MGRSATAGRPAEEAAAQPPNNPQEGAASSKGNAPQQPRPASQKETGNGAAAKGKGLPQKQPLSNQAPYATATATAAMMIR